MQRDIWKIRRDTPQIIQNFFACVIPLLPTPPSTSHPNWKLDPMLKHMMRVAKYGIHIDQPISIDEMDISFQGRHKDKQRVTYKKGGDCFLVDDLCAEVYTYLWHFINQLAPRKWIGYGIPPLHGRVMSLFEQLPEKTGNYICGMDNLFNSP